MWTATLPCRSTSRVSPPAVAPIPRQAHSQQPCPDTLQDMFCQGAEWQPPSCTRRRSSVNPWRPSRLLQVPPPTPMFLSLSLSPPLLWLRSPCQMRCAQGLRAAAGTRPGCVPQPAAHAAAAGRPPARAAAPRRCPRPLPHQPLPSDRHPAAAGGAAAAGAHRAAARGAAGAPVPQPPGSVCQRRGHPHLPQPAGGPGVQPGKCRPGRRACRLAWPAAAGRRGSGSSSAGSCNECAGRRRVGVAATLWAGAGRAAVRLSARQCLVPACRHQAAGLLDWVAAQCSLCPPCRARCRCATWLPALTRCWVRTASPGSTRWVPASFPPAAHSIACLISREPSGRSTTSCRAAAQVACPDRNERAVWAAGAQPS